MIDVKAQVFQIVFFFLHFFSPSEFYLALDALESEAARDRETNPGASAGGTECPFTEVTMTVPLFIRDDLTATVHALDQNQTQALRQEFCQEQICKDKGIACIQV